MSDINTIYPNINKNPDSQKPASKPWFKQRKWQILIIAAVIVVLFAFGVWLIQKQSQKNVTSKNPIVASYQQQLPGLASAAQKSPKDATAQQNYAVALYATGDLGRAKTVYQTALQLDPTNATLQNNLGNVYRDTGDYQNAIQSYQHAISLAPKTANAYINLANLYQYTLNKEDLAIKTYQDALQNIPNNQELQVLLGIAYEHSGDKASAHDIYQQVLTANPSNSAAQAGLKRVQ